MHIRCLTKSWIVYQDELFDVNLSQKPHGWTVGSNHFHCVGEFPAFSRRKEIDRLYKGVRGRTSFASKFAIARALSFDAFVCCRLTARNFSMSGNLCSFFCLSSSSLTAFFRALFLPSSFRFSRSSVSASSPRIACSLSLKFAAPNFLEDKYPIEVNTRSFLNLV